MTKPIEVLVLSTADYESPVWTNKQHIAHRLASDYKVFYVGSVGLRRPTVSKRDIRRIGSLLLSSFGKKRSNESKRADSDRLTTIRPRVLPWHGFRWFDRLNRGLLRFQLRAFNRSPALKILYSFSPLTFGQEDLADGVVYHSVDLLHEIPGVPREAVLAAERQLCSRADRVIASSAGVKRHLESETPGPVVELWENVADTDLFVSQGDERIPRAIFAGHLTETKLEVELLQEIVDAGIPLALAGPIAIDGTSSSAALRRLIADKNVTYLGNLDLSSLAREVRSSKVGLIPYRRNSYTDGVFPMKVYEYLSAGLSVVSTSIASFDERAPKHVRVEAEFVAFVNAVHEELLYFSDLQAGERSADARSHSWASRVAQISTMMIELSQSAGGELR